MDSSTTDLNEYEKANPIIVADELRHPHPITGDAAKRLGVVLEPSSGSVLPEGHHFGIHVSSHRAELALRLLDAFVRACETRGFDLRPDPTNTRHHGLSVFINGEPVPIGLYERGSFVTHLSFELGRHSSIYVGKRSWQDHPRRPLAKKLNTIMLNLRSIVAKRIAQREEQAESERRERAFLKERRTLRRQVEAEKEAVEVLYEEAADWQLAQNIRAYVAAVEAQPVNRQERKERTTWCTWAREQSDRLDPLTPSPPSILDTPSDRYREPGYEEYIDEDGNIAHV